MTRHSLATLLLAVLAAVVLLALGTRAWAHHSFGAFDVETELELRGEVVAFDWMQPHTVTRLAVTDDDGSVTTWVLEGMSPDYLGRRGWTNATLAPGDTITVVVHPQRDGGPGGTFLRCTLPDGTVKVMAAR